jgi:hypothetical protein
MTKFLVGSYVRVTPLLLIIASQEEQVRSIDYGIGSHKKYFSPLTGLRLFMSKSQSY